MPYNIKNKWSPEWSVVGCWNDINQGQPGLFGDLVSAVLSILFDKLSFNEINVYVNISIL